MSEYGYVTIMEQVEKSTYEDIVSILKRIPHKRTFEDCRDSIRDMMFAMVDCGIMQPAYFVLIETKSGWRFHCLADSAAAAKAESDRVYYSGHNVCNSCYSD